MPSPATSGSDRPRRRNASSRIAPTRQRVEREPDEPGLGRDRHRRRVRRGLLRILALEVHPFSVRALEPSHPDTRQRMVHGDADPVRDEARAAARRVVQPVRRVVLQRSPNLRLRDRDPGEHGEREHDRDERAPAPGDERRADHDDEQRGEARLRVGDQEPEPRHDERAGGDERPAERPAAEDEHDRRDHREHEEPPVHRRIPEHGVDAEEGRVRVRVDHLRVLEDVPRLVLVEADDRERERHHREHRVQRPQAEPAPRQPREREREQRERDVEREQLDRAFVHVLAPGKRQAGPADERRERPRCEAELPHAAVTLDELPREEDRRTEDDDVERHEELRARAADVHPDPQRHAREREQRVEPRHCAEEPCEPDAETERGEHSAEHEDRPVRRNRDPEEDGAERGEAETGDAVAAVPPDEQDREADARDRPAELREPAHLTITAARSTWPCSVTVSV